MASTDGASDAVPGANAPGKDASDAPTGEATEVAPTPDPSASPLANDSDPNSGGEPITYTASETNQVAPLLTVTRVPAGVHYPATEPGDDVLVFTNSDNLEEDRLSGQAIEYTITTEDASATVEDLKADAALALGIDQASLTDAGDVTLGGETSKSFSGTDTTEEGGTVAIRGALVVHNGQAYTVLAIAYSHDAAAPAAVSEQDFKVLCGGIQWAR